MASPPLTLPSQQLTPTELEALATETKLAILDYQYVFVTPFPEEVESTCSICLGILKQPQMISCCGHRFCLECIESIRFNPQCPLCKASKIQFFPDKKLERLISQRKVYCSLRNDGCLWTGELCKLQEHLDTDQHNNDAMGCPFFPVPCGYCMECVRRRNMPAHKTKCPHRPTTCEFCNTKLRHDQLKDHYKECPVCPTLCPNVQCSKPIKRWELNSHLEKCPWTPLTCKYHHAGCTRTIPRKDMDGHMRLNTEGHLKLLSTKVTKLEEEVQSRGEVSFLVISDLPEDALCEHKLKSRFGQFGLVNRVQLLDPALRAAVIQFSYQDTYQIVLDESKRGNIKFCREFVQANPVYSTLANDNCADDYIFTMGNVP